MTKKKQPTKIVLYTFCLGKTKESIEIHAGDILSPMYPSKRKALKAMRAFRKATDIWPTGTLISVTIEKVK